MALKLMWMRVFSLLVTKTLEIHILLFDWLYFVNCFTLLYSLPSTLCTIFMQFHLQQIRQTRFSQSTPLLKHLLQENLISIIRTGSHTVVYLVDLMSTFDLIISGDFAQFVNFPTGILGCLVLFLWISFFFWLYMFGSDFSILEILILFLSLFP